MRVMMRPLQAYLAMANNMKNLFIQAGSGGRRKEEGGRGWMDGWLDGWMDGFSVVCPLYCVCLLFVCLYVCSHVDPAAKSNPLGASKL